MGRNNGFKRKYIIVYLKIIVNGWISCLLEIDLIITRNEVFFLEFFFAEIYWCSYNFVFGYIFSGRTVG